MYHDDVETRRAEDARNRENSARLATAYATFKTTGQGSYQFAKRCDFGVTFIYKPILAYGAELDADDLGDLENIDGGETPVFPHSSGFVVDWDIDDRGFYVGAWVAARVTFAAEDLIDPLMKPEVIHTFSFTAIAMKDVPLTLRD